MKGFFITGTDTEVGKTLVTCLIVLQLQARGIKTLAYKPIAAGVQDVNGQRMNPDVVSLLQVSQIVQPLLRAEDICPYTLQEPAAPHIVAKDTGITLDMESLMAGFYALQNISEAIVVEGAGGFLVPINATQTLGDLAQQLSLPVILVVNIKLGCINHTLLTALAIAQHGLNLFGWVSNCTQAENPYTDKNITAIQEILYRKYQSRHLGHIPYKAGIAPEGIYSQAALAKLQHHLQVPIEAIT